MTIRLGWRDKSLRDGSVRAGAARRGSNGTVFRRCQVESVSAVDTACDVVLDYCVAVRGILNDDQGGPLQPPGLRMAEALQEVRESLRETLIDDCQTPVSAFRHSRSPRPDLEWPGFRERFPRRTRRRARCGPWHAACSELLPCPR